MHRSGAEPTTGCLDARRGKADSRDVERGRSTAARAGTQMEKDRDGCPKIVNLGSSKTDLFYERKKYGFKKR